MSIKILTDKDTFNSVMFDEATEIAFGPVFGEDEDPRDFLSWVNGSVTNISEYDVQRMRPHVLSILVDDWRKQVKENEAEAAGERCATEPGAWDGGIADNH